MSQLHIQSTIMQHNVGQSLEGTSYGAVYGRLGGRSNLCTQRQTAIYIIIGLQSSQLMNLTNRMP